MRAKKSLGQHFLREPSYAQRLASALPAETRNLVEVGPGTGMLTEHLLDHCDRLLLIEKDAALGRLTVARWRDQPKVTAVEADILAFNFTNTFDGEPFAVVGNFPYNISSQIVFRILELHDRVTEMIGMFQYEVAQRIVAGPGTKAYGIISVLVAAYYRGELLFSVPPSAFDPPPKVNSAVIRLTRHSETLPCSFASLRSVVRAAFGQRRKMLRNSLQSLLPADALQGAFFQQRPEHLGLSEFIDLAVELERRQKT